MDNKNNSILFYWLLGEVEEMGMLKEEDAKDRVEEGPDG